MKEKKIIIIGTGGNSIDIIDLIDDINIKSSIKYKCIGFLDDNLSMKNKEIMGIKVLGSLDSAKNYQDDNVYFVNSIGSPTNFWKKEKIIAKADLTKDRFISLIHPSASISQTASIGYGCVILRNASISAHAKIGNHIIIFPNSLISHNNEIGDYSTIMGGVVISGNVKIGKSSYLSPSCSIDGNKIIGNTCLIGMGSSVLQNVEDNSVMVGSPAKFLRQTYTQTI